jgi:hypothetical protein
MFFSISKAIAKLHCALVVALISAVTLAQADIPSPPPPPPPDEINIAPWILMALGIVLLPVIIVVGRKRFLRNKP